MGRLDGCLEGARLTLPETWFRESDLRLKLVRRPGAQKLSTWEGDGRRSAVKVRSCWRSGCGTGPAEPSAGAKSQPCYGVLAGAAAAQAAFGGETMARMKARSAI